MKCCWLTFSSPFVTLISVAIFQALDLAFALALLPRVIRVVPCPPLGAVHLGRGRRALHLLLRSRSPLEVVLVQFPSGSSGGGYEIRTKPPLICFLVQFAQVEADMRSERSLHSEHQRNLRHYLQIVGCRVLVNVWTLGSVFRSASRPRQLTAATQTSLVEAWLSSNISFMNHMYSRTSVSRWLTS